MSEETEQTDDKQPDKQSAIKEKLKKMGVMKDDNAAPLAVQHSFFHKHKILFMLFAIFIGALVWVSNNKNQSNDTVVAERPTMQQPYMMHDNPYGPMPPPPPPEYFQAGPQEGNFNGQPPSGWNPPPTRAQDVYGPPPGPPEFMYGRPYGAYGYYMPPPPPPAFYGNYGPYGPHAPHGPAQYYGNPYYGGNYPPPPSGYGPAN